MPLVSDSATPTFSGKSSAEYRGKSNGPVVIIAMLVFGMVISAEGLAMLRVGDSAGYGIGIFGSLFLVFAVFIAVRAFLERGLRISVYADGYLDERGGRTTAVRWGDVRVVVVDNANVRGAPPTQAYKVELNNGKRFTYSTLVKDVGKLGETLQNEVARVQLPAALQALEAGSRLTFGKLAVSRQGLHNGSETLAWATVDRISVSPQGEWMLAIWKKAPGGGSKWTSQKLRDIPNHTILLKLAERFARGR